MSLNTISWLSYSAIILTLKHSYIAEFPSLVPSISGAPTGSPSASPTISTQPSSSPTAFPTTIPSTAPTGAFYYPDWENEEQVCKNDALEPGYMKELQKMNYVYLGKYCYLCVFDC